MSKVTNYKNQFTREKYDRISLIIPKGEKESWQSEAERRGMSLNAFIQKAVEEYIKNDTTVTQ